MRNEEVYRIVANIVLQKPNEFKDIFPMLHGFHIAKFSSASHMKVRQIYWFS